jgi:site-specific recombinase XerD
MEPRPKKHLDQVRDTIRLKHYSYRTEESYVQWIRRYILFHDKRHPLEMGSAEIEAFLTDLAVNQQVAASTQNQALSALLFLYRAVLKQEVDMSIDAVRAKRSQYLPTVLTREEVLAVIQNLPGVHQLFVQILYGSYDIRTVQELLGHKDVKTTMIYTHVLNRGGKSVHSPLDW